MLGRSHVIGAVAVGVAAAAVTGHAPAEAAIVGGAAILTAKLPDVDRVVNDGPNHRSLTHSVVLAGGLVVALAFIAAQGAGALASAAIFGLAAGYLSHLALDAAPPKSIPLLWPGGPLFSLGSIATGKLGERIVVWVLVAAAVVVSLAVYGAGIT